MPSLNSEQTVTTERRLVSIREWTRISGVGRTSTYAGIREGKLKAHKFGGRTFLDLGACLAVVQARPHPLAPQDAAP